MLGEPARWSPEAHVREQHVGVRIVEMELPGQLQGCVDHEQRIIWLAKGLSCAQRRCTLAYEIGQLEQGPAPADPCLAAARQRAAEDWAARMLLPIDRLLVGFSVSHELPQIADYLEVDTPTLRARLRGLTDEEQDSIMETIHGMQATV